MSESSSRPDLERAYSTLPAECASDQAVIEYRDFLDHNEPELACDMLEAYAEEHPVLREFWLALLDAAENMKLSKNADRFRSRAEAG
jgi:hypothetical protein